MLISITIFLTGSFAFGDSLGAVVGASLTTGVSLTVGAVVTGEEAGVFVAGACVAGAFVAGACVAGAFVAGACVAGACVG
ncbi:MAG: hypothetical protein DBY03_05130 [Clostridiales bacterium]|nr:MAG: hypothetical protein DBY03_05130 [Clostridiales bacterium]